MSRKRTNFLEAGARAVSEITLFFEDRETARPYYVTVGASRTRHLRFNDLTDPEPVSRNTSYASVIIASEPVVIQHTSLDSRSARVALLSTVAFSQTQGG